MSVARDNSLKLWKGGDDDTAAADSHYVTEEGYTNTTAVYPNVSRFPNLRPNMISHDPMCVAVAGDVALTGGGSGDALLWELTDLASGSEPVPTATMEGHGNNVTGVRLIQWDDQ